MELTHKTALELGQGIRAGDFTAPEVTAAFLERIKKENEKLNALLAVLETSAMEQADKAQQRLGKGKQASPLDGVPAAVKDNLCTRGIRTTCASRMLKEYRPPYDAAAVEALRAGGAVLAGKCNMDEFAMGSANETSYFGAVKNPWDQSRTPGGSSGGPAAAVAAGLVPFALGSDTGGSIRQPASHCGVTGLKPSYGRVSRYGLVAYASSLDQVGPITKDAADAAAVLDLISGPDPRDATSARTPRGGFLDHLSGRIEGWRIGIMANCFDSDLNPDVAALVSGAGDVLAECGATLERFELQRLRYAAPAYYILASAEASSNLARYDGVRYGERSGESKRLEDLYCQTRSQGFGREVQRRIMLGTFVLSAGYYEAYYHRAQCVQAEIRAELLRLFQRYDLILLPTAPSTAPRLGESLLDPLKQYRSDVYTVLANLAGLPAISFPCGFDHDGMPAGAQLIGPMFGEQRLLDAVHRYQTKTEYHRKRPEGGA